MRYLLDVSPLIALALDRHQFHARVLKWVQSKTGDSFLSCSITELGFVRIVSQTPLYGYTLPEARALLLRLKKSRAFHLEFIADENDIGYLPTWVRTSKQTTDGHLQALAQSHNALLATLDEGIPGSVVIPH
jgi:uncharacterized protein